MKKIAPSILASDFAYLADEIKAVEKAGADYLHVDVMDGHFVPNITLGPPVIEKIKKVSSIPLDVHLMITEPEKYIKDFANAGSDIITIHTESTPNLHRAIQYIKEEGKLAGVSINPGTPACAVETLLDEVDLILVMTVNPGFGGQSFIESTLPKIIEIRKMIDASGRKIELEVDGGVKTDNIKRVCEAGADVFVAGSAIFKSDDYAKTIKEMKKEIS